MTRKQYELEISQLLGIEWKPGKPWIAEVHSKCLEIKNNLLQINDKVDQLGQKVDIIFCSSCHQPINGRPAIVIENNQVICHSCEEEE